MGVREGREERDENAYSYSPHICSSENFRVGINVYLQTENPQQ